MQDLVIMDILSIPVKNPAALARTILDNEMVLVNADTAASLALTNKTALLVWDLVDGSSNVQDIIEGVTSKFQNVPDTAADDILDLLELLIQDGFIGFEIKRDIQK